MGYSPQGRKESDMTEVTKYACIGLHWWLSGKNLPANAGDAGSIPGSG